MIAPARSAALRVLQAVDEGGVDLGTALANERPLLGDERDRALLTEVATGTVRWQRTLDHLIEAFAQRPIGDIDSRLMLVLRMGVYQILHLDRVPTAAVVDDAVDLARAVRRARGTGFVNAVLRACARQQHRLPMPPPPPDDADISVWTTYLGVTTSHPDWLVRRWLERFGRHSTEAWLAYNNTRPALTVRMLSRNQSRDELAARFSADGVSVSPTRFAPYGLTLEPGVSLPAWAEGVVTIQDEASQLLPAALGVEPGHVVLDVCAAPGGKSTAIAADLDGRGLVVACDVRARRVTLLRDTIRRAGVTNATVCRVATTGPLPFRVPFDRVLVDAPCSGSGTLRRDPDIRWRRHADDLSALAAAQRELLHRAADAVAPGGALLYATCSSEPEENDEVVSSFLARDQRFAHTDLRTFVATPLRAVIDSRGYLRTHPFAHGLDAFFGALLRRTDRG